MKLESSQSAGGVIRVVGDLFGEDNLDRPLDTPLAAHDLILHGIPAAALQHLIGRLEVLDKTEGLEKAVGMSLRTFQRRKDAPSRPLSPEQSGRAWVFAEILARAMATFGSLSEAEHWLDRPALALDGRRPIDLLATPAGTELVSDLIEQLDLGVYP